MRKEKPKTREEIKLFSFIIGPPIKIPERVI
jgi:hypothetical protein